MRKKLWLPDNCRISGLPSSLSLFYAATPQARSNPPNTGPQASAFSKTPAPPPLQPPLANPAGHRFREHHVTTLTPASPGQKGRPRRGQPFSAEPEGGGEGGGGSGGGGGGEWGGGGEGVLNQVQVPSNSRIH